MDPNIKCIGRILLVLYAVVAVGKALQCITCDNAKSHEECDKRGRVVTCNKNEEMCAIEERKVNQGPEKLIFKHCKQPLACSNNERQNPRPAWWPTQCNSRAVNSVCRCCCSGDLCNQGANTCFNRVANVCLPPRTNPRNGKVTCSDGNKIGSSCSFTCDAGHVMSGSKTSECGQDGTWSSPTPSCGPITCPRLSAGNKRIDDCSNGNHVGSVCRFTCEAGYEMIGSQSITCRDILDADVNGVWSSLPPTCRLITCTEPPTVPENGFRVCSDVNNIGSVCEFGCDEFYSRNGPLRTTCMNVSPRPAWDNMAPVCERVACSDQGVLPHGEITCEDSNFANSQCTFRCTADTYFISPADVTSNTCQNNTSWSKPKPCCARCLRTGRIQCHFRFSVTINWLTKLPVFRL
nr:P-selectin isoform X1 [Ciona intestinalis]|eukprot:XP_026692445.1 P-selectin isoform X1 [Ciona intestinalis]